MAKRAPVDQKPFTALDKGLAASVMSPVPTLKTEAVPDEPKSLPPQASPVAAETPVASRASIDAPAAAERIPEPQAAVQGPSIVARRPVVTPKIASDTALEKLSREKRFLLSPAEEREIERCVDRIAEGFGGTPVKLSHMIRACMTVIRHAESEIIRRAQEVGQLTRPPNGDAMALAEFEHELAKVLSTAFHDAPALR